MRRLGLGWRVVWLCRRSKREGRCLLRGKLFEWKRGIRLSAVDRFSTFMFDSRPVTIGWRCRMFTFAWIPSLFL